MIAAARLAFALSIVLHYIFPMITIGGLFWLFVTSCSNRVFELRRQVVRMLLFVSIGISTGYVLKWHFNEFWPDYLHIIATAFDPLLGIEALLSIAGFIVFASVYFWSHSSGSRLGIRFSLLGLFLTTLISSVIITSVNSWMQYPTGIRIMNSPLGTQFEYGNLNTVFFNPTFLTRLYHTLIGALMLGIAFQSTFSKLWRRSATMVLLLLWLGQFVVGHRHAAESYAFQPEKFAAFEGHNSTYSPADLWLFPGLDKKYNIKLSGMTSYLLYSDVDRDVAGTNAWKDEYISDRAEDTFVTYHVMILAHFLVCALLILKLFKHSQVREKTLNVSIVITLLVANLFGWFTAEWGRQPWIIRGVLKTQDAFHSGATVHPYTGVFYTLMAIVLPLIVYRLLRKKVILV